MFNFVNQFRQKASARQKKMAGGLFVVTALLGIATIGLYIATFGDTWKYKARENAINARHQAEHDRQGVKGYVWANTPAELDARLAEKPGANWVALTNVNTDAMMAALDKVPDLRIVTAIDPGITDDNLKHLANKVELRRIDFWKTTVSDEGLVHLKDLNKLEVLGLSHCQVTDAGLARLKTLLSLRKIQLGESVSGEGLAHLAELPELRDVGLHGAAVTDHGISFLTQIKQLERVNLYSTAITDKGVKHLAACKGLKDVYIPKTGVTDDGLQELAALPNLETVNVCETAVTEAGVARLLKQRPDIEVKYGAFDYSTGGLKGLIYLAYASVCFILTALLGFRLESYMRRTINATT